MMKSRFKPVIQVEKVAGNLIPLSEYDAIEIETHPIGQLYDVVPRSQRSPQHHKFYWAILGKVVRETNLWPSASHLHDDLKMLCGHYRTVINKMSGNLYYIPDSTAFHKMDQNEFADYFELAMAKLAEAIGYDPTISK